MKLLEIMKRDMTFTRVYKALIRRFFWIFHRIYFYIPWGFSKYNRLRLKTWENRYKNKRCFIIANGPSLKHIDFNLLKNEFTIGMNRIYLMKDENNFMPSCLACIDKERLIIPFHEDLDFLEIPCFFPFSCRKYFSKKNNQYFLIGSFSPKFQTKITSPMGNGKTVTYWAIQIAFCLGFNEVYIIGKDHSYNTKEKVGTAIEVKEFDDNHFIKNYFKPGQKWDVPDFEMEEYAYRLSRTAFEKHNRKIYNATIGGKLEIFERVDFYSLFN